LDLTTSLVPPSSSIQPVEDDLNDIDIPMQYLNVAEAAAHAATLNTLAIRDTTSFPPETHEVNTDDNTLEVLEGRDDTNKNNKLGNILRRHEANFCEGKDCKGTSRKIRNFGCGGVCYQNFNASSVNLKSASWTGPRPTARMFTSNNCTGPSKHVALGHFRKSKCTTSNMGTWHSAYLYWNC
jgi:hypothetical protein